MYLILFLNPRKMLLQIKKNLSTVLTGYYLGENTNGVSFSPDIVWFFVSENNDWHQSF